MAKKRPTKAEKDHMECIRALGCIIGALYGRRDCCPKIEVHHLTGAGMALRADHFETIPLCFNHHSAQTPLAFGHAVHKGTKTFEENYMPQTELLVIVREKLQCEVSE